VIESKGLRFVGVDYNGVYINKAKSVVLSAGVGDRVALHCRSVYEEGLSNDIGRDFDCAYFSGSFSLMPDPPLALQVSDIYIYIYILILKRLACRLFL